MKIKHVGAAVRRFDLLAKVVYQRKMCSLNHRLREQVAPPLPHLTKLCLLFAYGFQVCTSLASTALGNKPALKNASAIFCCSPNWSIVTGCT